MLSEHQKLSFREHGYLVVPDVVPDALCQSAIAAILDHTGVNLADRSSWYQEEYAGLGIVPLHHHQAFWDIRQYPEVYKVFADLYNDTKLWVSMDRASYKPPIAEETRDWQQAAIHWDCDPRHYTEDNVQGLVYLTDTEEDQGAFSCVPSIYQNLESYLVENAGSDELLHPTVADDDLISVGGKAGSLVIFHRLMPHTGRLNFSNAHRFVQYVTMNPVTNEAMRQQRIVQWRDKIPPEWALRQQIKNQQIPEPGEPAKLTLLGRKLVGVDEW